MGFLCQSFKLCLDKAACKNVIVQLANTITYYYYPIPGFQCCITSSRHKKGYWHVELDYESSVLCTFNSPFGRYRFKRLSFGVNISQDVFQHKLDEVFKNIPNVGGIADDILIVGNTPQEHDHAFINMLEASRNNNVSLN